jgi:hypothetical protein
VNAKEVSCGRKHKQTNKQTNKQLIFVDWKESAPLYIPVILFPIPFVPHFFFLYLTFFRLLLILYSFPLSSCFLALISTNVAGTVMYGRYTTRDEQLHKCLQRREVFRDVPKLYIAVISAPFRF